MKLPMRKYFLIGWLFSGNSLIFTLEEKRYTVDTTRARRAAPSSTAPFTSAPSTTKAAHSYSHSFIGTFLFGPFLCPFL